MTDNNKTWKFSGDERVVNRDQFLTTLAPFPDPEILQQSISKNTASQARKIYHNILEKVVSNPAQVCSSKGLDVSDYISLAKGQELFNLVHFAITRFGYKFDCLEQQCFIHIEKNHQEEEIERIEHDNSYPF